MNTWTHALKQLPPLHQKVIVTDYRVDCKPEYDNQHITYLTEDCNTGEIIWFSGESPNKNQYWMPLPDPPSYDKFKIDCANIEIRKAHKGLENEGKTIRIS